jgi:hypothetical protein
MIVWVLTLFPDDAQGPAPVHLERDAPDGLDLAVRGGE